jgi:hypothetical protein
MLCASSTNCSANARAAERWVAGPAGQRRDLRLGETRVSGRRVADVLLGGAAEQLRHPEPAQLEHDRVEQVACPEHGVEGAEGGVEVGPQPEDPVEPGVAVRELGEPGHHSPRKLPPSHTTVCPVT